METIKVKMLTNHMGEKVRRIMGEIHDVSIKDAFHYLATGAAVPHGFDPDVAKKMIDEAKEEFEELEAEKKAKKSK